MASVEVPSHLTPLFREDQRERTGVERREVGTLRIPDGRVFVCDPMAPAQKSALDREVEPGNYAVEVFAVGPDLVAGVLVLRGGSPVHWALAGPRDPSANPDREPGIDVEVGTLCIAGSEAAETLFLEEGDGDAAMEVHDRGDSDGVVDVAPGRPMAVFFTGGDGGYYAWWGEDDAGNTCALVLDICDPARLQPPAPQEPPPPSRAWWKFWHRRGAR